MSVIENNLFESSRHRRAYNGPACVMSVTKKAESNHGPTIGVRRLEVAQMPNEVWAPFGASMAAPTRAPAFVSVRPGEFIASR
jgi:hypothetical protein